VAVVLVVVWSVEVVMTVCVAVVVVEVTEILVVDTVIV
jgi:hypothetical protein